MDLTQLCNEQSSWLYKRLIGRDNAQVCLPRNAWEGKGWGCLLLIIIIFVLVLLPSAIDRALQGARCCLIITVLL